MPYPAKFPLFVKPVEQGNIISDFSSIVKLRSEVCQKIINWHMYRFNDLPDYFSSFNQRLIADH